MSQLALAQERQLIQRGCSVRFTVAQQPVAKTIGSDDKSDDSDDDNRDMVAPIKMQLLKKGTFKDQYVDIDLSTTDNPFLIK